MQDIVRKTILLMAVSLLAACNSSSDGGGATGGGDNASGSGGSGSGSLSALSSPEFFIGNDGRSGDATKGSQLWITDGTEDNTQVVKVIRPAADAKMQDFTYVGDKLYFTAEDGDDAIRQLWVSDGTEEGTLRLTDSNKLVSVSLLTALGDTLYFRGHADGGDAWIWVSDGTAEGTVEIGDGAPNDNGVRLLTAFNDHLYFAFHDGTVGEELWRTDGTADNTELVANIQPTGTGFGSMNQCTDRLVELDGLLYFVADDDPSKCALWRTNGEIGHAEKIKTIADTVTNDATEMVATNGRLYFLGNALQDVWVSNGTEEGTQVAFTSDDAFRLLRLNSTYPFLAAGDYAYFQVNNGSKDSSEARELWYANGSDSGPVVALDSTASGDGLEMAVSGDTLFYVHDRPVQESDFITGNKGIWTAKGTDIELIHSGYTASNGGKPLIPTADANLLFSSMGEVWRTNGTATAFVKDICPGLCFGFLGPN